MDAPAQPLLLQIKKYPNRRFYDATRSRHVNLQELYELIMAGHDLVVADSRNGDDITNLILLQIILEKDEPKLDLFPSSMLHQFIRSNRTIVRATLEHLFGPYLQLWAASQKQFDTYLREAMRGNLVTPLDWASNLMKAFSDAAKGRSADGQPEPPADIPFSAPPAGAAGVSAPPPGDESIDELRAQVAELTRRIEELHGQQNGPAQVDGRHPRVNAGSA